MSGVSFLNGCLYYNNCHFCLDDTFTGFPKNLEFYNLGMKNLEFTIVRKKYLEFLTIFE